MKKSTKNLMIAVSTIFAAACIHRQYKISKSKKTLEDSNNPKDETENKKGIYTILYRFTKKESKETEPTMLYSVKEVELEDLEEIEAPNKKRHYYKLPFRKQK